MLTTQRSPISYYDLQQRIGARKSKSVIYTRPASCGDLLNGVAFGGVNLAPDQLAKRGVTEAEVFGKVAL